MRNAAYEKVDFYVFTMWFIKNVSEKQVHYLLWAWVDWYTWIRNSFLKLWSEINVNWEMLWKYCINYKEKILLLTTWKPTNQIWYHFQGINVNNSIQVFFNVADYFSNWLTAVQKPSQYFLQNKFIINPGFQKGSLTASKLLPQLQVDVYTLLQCSTTHKISAQVIQFFYSSVL